MPTELGIDYIPCGLIAPVAHYVAVGTKSLVFAKVENANLQWPYVAYSLEGCGRNSALRGCMLIPARATS